MWLNLVALMEDGSWNFNENTLSAMEEGWGKFAEF